MGGSPKWLAGDGKSGYNWMTRGRVFFYFLADLHSVEFITYEVRYRSVISFILIDFDVM